MTALLIGIIVGIGIGDLIAIVFLVVMAIREERNKMMKIKMCEKSIQSGVCPHVCSKCAWNTEETCQNLTQKESNLEKRK